MTNKEVGELWALWKEDDAPSHSGCRDAVIKLIRKFVEERQRYCQQRGWNAYDAKQLALRNFGIDEKEWPG